MFNAVYVNFAECYGPDGSLPLRQALETLLGTEDVSTYRSDGFALIYCPVKGEHVAARDGEAVILGPDGSVIILGDIEPFRQEVSNAMTYIKALYPTLPTDYDRFIIPAPKPDPLAQTLGDFDGTLWEPEDVLRFRAALEARGLTITTLEKD